MGRTRSQRHDDHHGDVRVAFDRVVRGHVAHVACGRRDQQIQVIRRAVGHD